MAHFNTVIAEHPDWELAGIYADEGISGTQVKNRVQFQQMIEDAKAKKIDLILTKSISRFARNVVDCLTNIRLLRSLRPPVSVYFDKERLDSLDEKAEVFLTMLASFALGGVSEYFNQHQVGDQKPDESRNAKGKYDELVRI